MKKISNFIILAMLSVNAVLIYTTFIAPSSISNMLAKSNSAEYKSGADENKELMLSYAKSSATKKLVEAIPVYVRERDKYASLYVKFMNKISTRNYNTAISIAEGSENGFHFLKEHDKFTSPSIWLGVEKLSEEGDSLVSVFANKKIALDFIYFHEFAHYLSYFAEISEPSIMDEYISNLPRKLSSEESRILRSLYSESIGDMVGIMLLMKKYPDIDPNISSKIAGYRLRKAYDVEHLSVPSLVADIKPQESLEDVLNFARNNAYLTTEFYLPVISTLAREDNTEEIGSALSESKYNTIRQRIAVVQGKYPKKP